MKQKIITIGARDFLFTLFEDGSAEISKAICPIEKISLNREQVLDIHDEIASFYNLPVAPKDPPLKEVFNPLEPDKGAHRIILPDKKSKELMKKWQEESLTRTFKICPERQAPCTAPDCQMIKEGVCQLNPSIYPNSEDTKEVKNNG